MKKWTTAPDFIGDKSEIKREFGDLLGELLLRRGITDTEKARGFFACSHLSDPADIADMEKAAEVITQALDDGRKITVFGDYDTDGVTATAILYSYLEEMGAEVDFYIPERAEGYGMNIPALTRIIDGGTELIITVDTGISNAAEAEYIRSRGVQLVITDHHMPPEVLPVCDACVNPHRADDLSEFKELCGAGVVLKLLCIMDDEETIFEQYAELAAVGTVGDVVPLRGENRYIVRRGLDGIHTRQNCGLTKLIGSAGLNPEKVTSGDIAFKISPRINAAGRISSASKAVRLLLSDSEDTAARISEELELLNTERRNAEDAVVADVDRQIREQPELLLARVLVVAGKGWNHGLIGIIAARLLEKYGKPVFLISVENGEGRGSARSLDGFMVHKALSACSDLLLKYGGHPKAGGFSLSEDRIDEFRERLNEYAKNTHPQMPEPEIFADMETTAAELTVDNVRLLGRLAPFGEGNQKPAFILRGCKIISKNQLKNGLYTSFVVQSGGAKIKCLSFRTPFAKFYPAVGSTIDVLGSPELNEFNGAVSVDFHVSDYRPSDFREDRFFAAKRVYEALRRGEGCDPRLAPRVIPSDRKALMEIYDLVKRCAGMSAEEMCLYGGSNVNYCMLRITLDAFAQAGMVELSPDAQSAAVIPVTEKRDLFANGLLAELNSAFKAPQNA